MDLADVHYLIEGLAAAAALAGMLADAAGGGGQRVIEEDRFAGIFEAAFPEEFEESGNVHAQRATVLARRYGELLADAGQAAVRNDMVVVLLAEVADGGEYGIGGGLA